MASPWLTWQCSEQLEKIEAGLVSINSDMQAAEKALKGMELCCGVFPKFWKRLLFYYIFIIVNREVQTFKMTLLAQRRQVEGWRRGVAVRRWEGDGRRTRPRGGGPGRAAGGVHRQVSAAPLSPCKLVCCFHPFEKRNRECIDTSFSLNF